MISWAIRRTKKTDNFLATDCILIREACLPQSTIPMYFVLEILRCANSLADIQIEEQNHAEMLYKYKTVNGMS